MKFVLKYLTILCLPITLHTAQLYPSEPLLDTILRINPCLHVIPAGSITREGDREEEEIGKGAFGKVYRGTMTVDKVDVALKEINVVKKKEKKIDVALKQIDVVEATRMLRKHSYHPKYLNEEDVRAAICFESDFLIKVSRCSANVVKFYGLYQEKGKLYFVMKRYKTTLEKKMMEESSVTRQQLIRYATDIAHGLKKLHEKGIFHRDLKLDNFLADEHHVDEHDHVAIADFGGSTSEGCWWKFVEEGVQSKRYKSPETVLDWQKVPDAKDDIYALGLIFWVLAKGENEVEDFSWEWIKNSILTDKKLEGLRLTKKEKKIIEEVKRKKNFAVSPMEEINKIPELKRKIEKLIYDSPPRRGTTDFTNSFDELINRCLRNNPKDRPSASEIEEILLELLANEGGRTHAEVQREREEWDAKRRNECEHLFGDYVDAKGRMEDQGKTCREVCNLKFLQLNENQLNVAMQHLYIDESAPKEEILEIIGWISSRDPLKIHLQYVNIPISYGRDPEVTRAITTLLEHYQRGTRKLQPDKGYLVIDFHSR